VFSPTGSYGQPSQPTDIPTELAGKDSLVASWNLKRHEDWSEVRGILLPTSHRPRSSKSKYGFLHISLSHMRNCRHLPDPIIFFPALSIYLISSHSAFWVRISTPSFADSILTLAAVRLRVCREVKVNAYSGWYGLWKGFPTNYVFAGLRLPSTNPITCMSRLLPTLPRSDPDAFITVFPVRGQNNSYS
jgi:hypothetical protein